MKHRTSGDSVYPSERRRRIVEMLRHQGSVAVRELARRFEVSASTIRRDLNALERAGLLDRNYGGG